MLGKIKLGLLVGVGFSVLAGSANAAAVAKAPPAPEPTPIAAVSVAKMSKSPFEGFYIGAHTGYSWADTNIDYAGTYAGSISSQDFGGPIAGSTKAEGKGWQLGGQAGVNHVYDSGLLVGAEVGGSWAAITGKTNFTDGDVTLGGDQNIDGLGFAQLKLGWANEKFAVYGLGGLALANISEKTTASVGGLNLATISGSRSTPGWTVGAGADMMISEKVSIGATYNYSRFEYDTNYAVNENAFYGILSANIDTQSKLDVQTLKVNLNYHF
jgi:outer membrane immunogenic protein